VDQYGVEDNVFCEVDITILYNFTRTTKFAHMNVHWKVYGSIFYFLFSIDSYVGSYDDQCSLKFSIMYFLVPIPH